MLKAFASLFQNGCTPMDAIKWKEIYEKIEDAINAIERVAEIVER